MEVESLMLLFVFLYIVEASVQIFTLHRYRKWGESEDWFNFLGIHLTTFICNVIACLYLSNQANGLGSGILCVLIFVFAFGINFVLLIAGLIIMAIVKKKMGKREEERKNSFSIFKNIIIILLCNLFIMFFIPSMVHHIMVKNGERFIVDYLSQRYGNGNYKVVDVYKEYSNIGMFDKSLSGYCYEIKSSHMDSPFIVTIDKKITYVEDDYFIPVYFSEKLNLSYELFYSDWYNSIEYDFNEFEEYILEIIEKQYSIGLNKYNIGDIYRDYVSSWNNIDGVTYSPNYYMIPSTYGKVPTIDELIELIVVHYMILRNR